MGFNVFFFFFHFSCFWLHYFNFGASMLLNVMNTWASSLCWSVTSWLLKLFFPRLLICGVLLDIVVSCQSFIFCLYHVLMYMQTWILGCFLLILTLRIHLCLLFSIDIDHPPFVLIQIWVMFWLVDTSFVESGFWMIMFDHILYS